MTATYVQTLAECHVQRFFSNTISLYMSIDVILDEPTLSSLYWYCCKPLYEMS
jgi:hypothetical protein